MGLDMYLIRHVYMYKFDKQLPITLTNSNGDRVEISSDDILHSEVAYWRKANAIHKWFIDNCNNGVDDCQEFCVNRDQLKTLLSICKKVKDNPNLGERLLPTQSGFFFGSTEYNEGYLEDINLTIKQLEDVLNKYNDHYFYYGASW